MSGHSHTIQQHIQVGYRLLVSLGIIRYKATTWWRMIDLCTITCLISHPTRNVWWIANYPRNGLPVCSSLQWRDNERDGVSNTGISIVCLTVDSGADKKYQSPASLAFVQGIHRRPVNSPHKRPVTRKKIPFDDVIMWNTQQTRMYETRA